MRKTRQKTEREPTIALINIVFLMLIFFLVAGTLAQPLDSSLSLVRTADLEGRAPPDTLVVHADGRLSYRGRDVASAQAYLDLRAADATQMPDSDPDAPTAVRLVPDRDLPAAKLVALGRDLAAAGAGSVMIVTERALD